MKKPIFAALLALCALPALADSWDSNSNIDKAVSKAVASFKGGGVGSMISEAKSCYAGLDFNRFTSRNLSRDVEYCIALEVAAAKISNQEVKAGRAEPNPYLSLQDVFGRAASTLEKARIVTLPEQINQYLVPRFEQIGRVTEAKLQ